MFEGLGEEVGWCLLVENVAIRVLLDSLHVPLLVGCSWVVESILGETCLV